MRLLQFGLSAIAAAMVASDLAGCAATHPSAQRTSQATLPGTPGCFLRSNFRGDWQVLDNRNLILYAPWVPNRTAYLIRLAQPVVGLNFNLRLGIQSLSTSNRICGLSANLLVPGNTPPRILITAVQELTPTEHDQLLAQAGKPPQRHVAASSLAQPD
jgi:hypothetical protein